MRDLRFLYRKMAKKQYEKQHYSKKHHIKVETQLQNRPIQRDSSDIVLNEQRQLVRLQPLESRCKCINEIFIKMGIFVVLAFALLYNTKTEQNHRPNNSVQLETKTPEMSDRIPQDVEIQWPTVSFGILVRNKEHSLPYFLHHLDLIDYPRDRIDLLFYSDFNQDESIEVLNRWINNNDNIYHSIQFEHPENVNKSMLYDTYWTTDHYKHILSLKQKLLDSSRYSWADFFFSIDADVILTEPKILRMLIAKSALSKDDEPISVIAPMLNCTDSEYYSNFWGDMTSAGYYKRSEDYFDIKNRFKIGVFPVSIVHSAFLINLRHQSTSNLKFFPLPIDYDGPIDDLIVFARSTQVNGVKVWIDNRYIYGFFHSPVKYSDLKEFDNSETFLESWIEREKELFDNLRLQVMINTEGETQITKNEQLFHDEKQKLIDFGFDKIYVINLKRRDTRLNLMKYCLKELGIAWHLFDAFDGEKLNKMMLESWGVKQLDGYADPYHKRALKYGEIGCFLSHYKIWQEMIEKNYSSILVFEDDVRFSSGFVRKMWGVLEDADNILPNWELMYIGRKIMSKNETYLQKSNRLVWPNYSYWTLGYALKKWGAEKLLAQKPLGKMVAVDEFIPIMFNRHPNKEWLKKFEPRDLVAISTNPLLVEPCHFTGEALYKSDTEDSSIVFEFDRQSTNSTMTD